MDIFFYKIRGKKLFWDRENQLFLGIILTPEIQTLSEQELRNFGKIAHFLVMIKLRWRFLEKWLTDFKADKKMDKIFAFEIRCLTWKLRKCDSLCVLHASKFYWIWRKISNIHLKRFRDCILIIWATYLADTPRVE